VILLLLLACTPASDSSPGDSAGDTAPDAWTLDPVELGGGSVWVGDTELTYTLLQVTRPDGQPTFLQWIPPVWGEPGASIVVQAQPYDGIDWTGAAVDATFAAASPRAEDGLYADVACEGGADRGIGYAPLDPDDAASSAIAHLLNGHGVLLAYGRYYACDDIVGEAEDMRAALAWARAEAPEARIGTWGMSWGGFLALYGGAEGDAQVVVPIVPPADMDTMLAHIAEMDEVYPDPSALGFFDSYVDRIERGLARDPGRFTTEALCGGLGGKDVLVLHDEWDTLVPVAGTDDLVARCGVESLIWPRQGPVDYAQVGLDHGLLGDEPGYASVFTFSLSYLYAHLNDADTPILTLGDRASIETFFGPRGLSAFHAPPDLGLPQINDRSSDRLTGRPFVRFRIIDLRNQSVRSRNRAAFRPRTLLLSVSDRSPWAMAPMLKARLRCRGCSSRQRDSVPL
jgi:hypothetical protein